MKAMIGSLFGGLLFGAGLGLSGMTDPSRVLGFLNVASVDGAWDPTLAFVMGGAMAVFATGYWTLRSRFKWATNGSEPVSSRLIIGAILFGIGWGLGGLCPGPALANLARMSHEVWIFVPAMAIGMIVAQRGFGADA